MDHDSYPDSYIRGILNTVKTIAMVGASDKENRPSYFAFKYLLERGYTMIPVNPGHAGADMLGRRIYARLADIPVPIDMVDIFRASRYAPAIVEEALTLKPRPQVIWMQLGIRSEEAAALAEANGLKVVMNRCPKIEYGRLSSEIAWMGVNTRTITSRTGRRSAAASSVCRLTAPPGAAARPTRPPPPRARKATTAEPGDTALSQPDCSERLLWPRVFKPGAMPCYARVDDNRQVPTMGGNRHRSAVDWARTSTIVPEARAGRQVLPCAFPGAAGSGQLWK